MHNSDLICMEQPNYDITSSHDIINSILGQKHDTLVINIFTILLEHMVKMLHHCPAKQVAKI